MMYLLFFTALISAYCLGRAHEISRPDKAADYWYNAYMQVQEQLFRRLKP